MSKYLNVFVQEQFESGGELKSNYTKVGVAYPHDKGEGFNLKITPGLSVSGDLVVFPPRESEDS
ncbi:hypothetical protein [Pseudohalioglobus lutimaris]|uniref:Uncharacterized protein n=1 Tax=Pseudohalioglobus lutimaris TaxID=1737061 RepID=A0A2N5X013_9GAMM|nr:hypothetical protein [Pseudohalioglobus lutimaris]PLW67817.1 hypothetical protein C0039_15475 [Pseudohalioglobus lutimaris]